MQEIKLENQDILEKFIRFNGATNVNVFVSAFLSYRTKIKNPTASFKEFLTACAPYNNESELENYLEQKFQITTQKTNFKADRLVDYNRAFNELKTGYEFLQKNKDGILIEHEAEQIVALYIDLSRGRRPVFVTADASLRRIVSESEKLCRLSGSILSEVGFLGMVDLLVGLSPNTEVYTRLIWGLGRKDGEQQVRDYLISRSVSFYNEGLLVQMPQLLRTVLSEHSEGIQRMGPFGNKDVNEIQESLDFVDRIELEYLNKQQIRVQQIRDEFGPGAI
ncbi:hypothetical protein llg_05490 [Luteolibacter sp. LG18]|nr:hypothetical protein llg_05490 [Luteolibacter sp. LG18]